MEGPEQEQEVAVAPSPAPVLAAVRLARELGALAMTAELMMPAP